MRKEQRDRKKNSILRSLNSLEQLSGYSEIVSVRKSFRKNHSASKFVKCMKFWNPIMRACVQFLCLVMHSMSASEASLERSTG
jgi:hypothetical protein